MRSRIEITAEFRMSDDRRGLTGAEEDALMDFLYDLLSARLTSFQIIRPEDVMP